MLKHNFVFAVSLVAMLTVGLGVAHADIASTVYVQQGVNSAKTAASNAQTSANNANTAASNAQNSANMAQAAAEAAQASADEAAASAKTANDTVATKVTANTAITGATKTKITYDSKGLVTGGEDLTASDIPTLAISKISGLTDALSGKEATTNKVTSLSEASTDTQYPSAKAVYTELAKKQNALTIDTALSSTSTNPVQNKVVNTALSGKQATLTGTNVKTTGDGTVVTAVEAANGVVTVTKGTTLGSLATKSTVASADITDGTIATADLANEAVTTAKIGDGAITAAKTSGVIGSIPSGGATSTTYATIWVE